MTTMFAFSVFLFFVHQCPHIHAQHAISLTLFLFPFPPSLSHAQSGTWKEVYLAVATDHVVVARDVAATSSAPSELHSTATTAPGDPSMQVHLKP